MAFADDLLEQAQHLAHREKKRPKQASLRRAISTAYYALFHLLVSEAISNWKVPGQRADLARAFEHGRMKEASKRIAGRSFPGSGPSAVSALRNVAKIFERLQQSRHKADYDNSTQWTRTSAVAEIDVVGEAFSDWQTIRHEPIAQDYLLSLLVKDR
jgi:uncharacterized protein (UPF0332 family)